MPMRIGWFRAFAIGMAFSCLGVLAAVPAMHSQNAPVYKVDPFWPKRLPNKWSMQQIVDIYVDKEDHVWVINRASDARPSISNRLHANLARVGRAGASLILAYYAAILVAAVLSALLFAICVSSLSAFISSFKVSLSSFAAVSASSFVKVICPSRAAVYKIGDPGPIAAAISFQVRPRLRFSFRILCVSSSLVGIPFIPLRS